MTDYQEQQAELLENIDKINSDINNTQNLKRKSNLQKLLTVTLNELTTLREHNDVMTKPVGTVLKDNGLDANMPNNPDFVAERLQTEMQKAAEAGDMATYKHLRTQRKKLKASAGPGGVLIGTDPRNISQ